MAKIKAPLFSLDASGTLDKTLTYRKKPQNNTASRYSKPGSVNPFESSPRQKDQRSIIGLITACWQSKTSLDKLSWDASAKAARFKGSGYHYFLHLAKTDLTTYLGLVGFWSMNYSNGDSVPDLSGNGNDGTLKPIYPCDSPTPVNSYNSKNGKAYNFNGTTHYISQTPFPYLPIFSLESYFKTNTLGSTYKSIFTKSLTGNNRNFWFAMETTPGKLALRVSIGGISYFTTTTGRFDDSLWHHAVGIYDNTSLRIYVDGLLQHVPFVLSGLPDNPTVPLFFSYFTTGNLWSFKGSLDNLRIWNRPLSPQEIQRHYNLLI